MKTKNSTSSCKDEDFCYTMGVEYIFRFLLLIIVFMEPGLSLGGDVNRTTSFAEQTACTLKEIHEAMIADVSCDDDFFANCDEGVFDPNASDITFE